MRYKEIEQEKSARHHDAVPNQKTFIERDQTPENARKAGQ